MKGTEVVTTRGRTDNKSFRTAADPILPELPLAVLVNGNTASAAEIVAGALQDLDRAVIVGQRSFGKGLVQSTRPLGYNTYLKLTTAKYYIPSGRCIQAVDYSRAREEGARSVPDSLIREYATQGGRKVYDGGGIEPDLHTEPEYISRFAMTLYALGFIEDYGDPLGRKASWEANVNFRDEQACRRTEIISANAQWFEDNSPVDPAYKKKTVKGVSAKVITVAMLGGDCYPATPIGINLPNADWIRKEHGSKSVTIDNITYAYKRAAQGDGSLEEFVLRAEDRDRMVRFGKLGDDLHTDLHECLGHGSGQLAPGTKGTELRTYTSTLEEARLTNDMMEAASQTVLLVDSTKFGRRGFAKICPLDRIDIIVTDDGISEQAREYIEEAGVDLIIAKTNGCLIG